MWGGGAGDCGHVHVGDGAGMCDVADGRSGDGVGDGTCDGADDDTDDGV